MKGEENLYTFCGKEFPEKIPAAIQKDQRAGSIHYWFFDRMNRQGK